MKKPRISALNPVLDGYEDTRNKENNGRHASISFSRGIKSRKRRKLRQPSSSGSTGSNSSISGVSRGSSGSEDFTTIHNNDQEMPISTIGVMGLPEGNNNVIETGKVMQDTLCAKFVIFLNFYIILKSHCNLNYIIIIYFYVVRFLS